MRIQAYSVLRAGLLAGILGCLPLPGATIILLDFDNDGPNPFGFWNIIGLPGSGMNNLVDSNGVVTSLSVASAGWDWGLGYDLDNWIAGDTDWLQDNAADDGWSVEDGVGSITFSGLDDLMQYRIEVVATSRFNGDIADYMIEGEWASLTYTGATGGTLGNDWDALVDGNVAADWLIWDGISTDGSGNITLTVDGTGSFGDVSAIRLVILPEPGTSLLLGLALLPLARRRRRA